MQKERQQDVAALLAHLGALGPRVSPRARFVCSVRHAAAMFPLDHESEFQSATCIDQCQLELTL